MTTPAADARDPGTLRISFLGGEFVVEWSTEDGTEAVRLPNGTTKDAFAYLAMQKNLRPLSLGTLSVDLGVSEKTVESGISRNKKDLPILQTPFGWKISPDQVDVLHFERLANEALDAARSKRHETAQQRATEALAVWTAELPDFSGCLATTQARFSSLRGDLLVMLDQLERGQRPLLHNLPPQDEHELLGREAELATLRSLLRPYPASQHAVILIDGIGGVGKTALASAIAHGYVSEPPDDADRFAAVVWVSGKTTALGTTIRQRRPTLRSLLDLHSAIALTMQRPDILNQDAATRERQVQELLSDEQNRVLIVADNLETVEDDGVWAFLENPPAPTKVVATTRHRLEGGYPRRLRGLLPEPAQHLIRSEAQRLGVELSPDEVQALAEVSDGVPLAIIWTVGQIANGYDAVTAIDRLRSANGQYALFAFNESIDQLRGGHTPKALDVLFAASHFEYGATSGALGFTAGLSAERNDPERDLALRTLRDMSLLNFTSKRYSMLSLTRDFVQLDLARDLELKNRTFARWVEWHEVISALGVETSTELDAKRIEPLKEEHRNILAVVEYTYRNDIERFFQFVRNLAFYWITEGLWQEFEHYVSLAKNSAPNPEDRIRFANRLLWLAALRDDKEAAADLRHEVDRLLRLHDLPYERMRFLDFAGQEAMLRDDLDDAEQNFGASLAAALDLGDERGVFAAKKYLGEVACRRFDAKTARRWANEAGHWVRSAGQYDWLRLRAHLAHLDGLIAELERDWASACTSFTDCLSTLEIHHDVRLSTRALKGRARSLVALGQSETAHVDFLNAADLFDALGMWTASSDVRLLAAGSELP